VKCETKRQQFYTNKTQTKSFAIVKFLYFVSKFTNVRQK